MAKDYTLDSKVSNKNGLCAFLLAILNSRDSEEAKPAGTVSLVMLEG